MIVSLDEDFYILRIFDKDMTVLEIINDVYKKYLKKGGALFEFYFCINDDVIVLIKRSSGDIKLKYHFNTFSCYLIDYFDIDKVLRKKGDVYYYQGDFYIFFRKKIGKKAFFLVGEKGKLVLGSVSLDIINKGIKLSHNFSQYSQI